MRKDKNMAYFPFMIELKDKNCVIAGGGRVAARKVETMLEFGANVTVIAPEISEEILRLAEQWNFTVKCLAICEEDLSHADIVIMATDDEKVNSLMAAFCREHHILVNVVDVKEECDFYFPAIIKQEDVVIAVSTGGESPLLAARIKKDIQQKISACYGKLAKILGKVRGEILSQVKAPAARKQLFAELLEQGLEQEGELSKEQIDEKIRKYHLKERGI